METEDAHSWRRGEQNERKHREKAVTSWKKAFIMLILRSKVAWRMIGVGDIPKHKFLRRLMKIVEKIFFLG